MRAIAVQVWAKPLPVGDGLPGATLVFADISVQQRDQQALRKTLLEQQAILESAAVGIVFSRGGFIEECNIRAAEMLGYARHQLTGMPGAVLYRSAEHCRSWGGKRRRCCPRASPTAPNWNCGARMARCSGAVCTGAPSIP